MKVVILAGGFGTRISEESHLVPKPMIKIGDKPILWHIMKYYSSFGHNDFIICGGYKQEVIKEFFNNYHIHMSDVTFDYKNNSIITHNSYKEPWKVTVLDTGLNTMTGGRIKKVEQYLEDENFLLTYGDGVSDVNIDELIEFHMNSKKLATITAVQPGGRFGSLEISNNLEITKFNEKHLEDGGWINGGFMVLNKKVLDLIDDDNTIFEKKPLEKLATIKQLNAFKHYGYWQCMDTLRDKIKLESEYKKREAKWIKE
jgi:glucose-1-phosphate cytidylyltransferase